MAKPKTNPESMLPLTPAVFHVLLSLAGGDRHGYAIMQDVAESTEGQIKLGPGTLYGTVKRLLEAQLIEESDERPDAHLDDERRRYYRLTGVGEQVVRAEANRYADIVAIARGKKLIGKAARGFALLFAPSPRPSGEQRQRLWLGVRGLNMGNPWPPHPSPLLLWGGEGAGQCKSVLAWFKGGCA